MEKIAVYIGVVLIFSIQGGKSQIIKIDRKDIFCLTNNKSTSYLKINLDNNTYVYKVKRVSYNPRINNKIYRIRDYHKIPKEKGKMFSNFESLRYGGGYFLIEKKYYVNLGTPIN
ncbi:hypothetical protein PG326_09430 [Riemerella anatipestifer]|nr:hypothetical protein [Riemerella anatipestifer]MDY3358540.1 hypothetical protein [Riemerella anatipestifer]